MVKVITIKDESYNKLLRIKRKLKGSFSDAIEHLVEYYERGEHAKGIINLAGSVGRKDVRKDRLRRVLRWQG